ncbi:auxin efflux carrier family protein, partial [Lecanoromycetidae sp. Uapishka_2]
MANEVLTSFLGAIQASLSVLLVISYGVIAAQFNILQGDSTKQISTLCVRMFLPALLITNVGSQLHADTGLRYVPILIWGLFYALTSMLLGWLTTRFFKLPSWVTPAISFNNTTALPLLLIESLSSTGILDDLLASDTDTTSAALMRAKSYFLVNAIVGDSLTFAMGPKLLDGEDAPKKKENGEQAKPNTGNPSDGTLFPQNTQDSTQQSNGHAEHNEQDREVQHDDDSNEQTSLLPGPVVRGRLAAERFGYSKGKMAWDKFPPWLQAFLDFSYAFLHAPLIGAVTGAIIGLVPPLHKAFFGDPEAGGIFTAWLTDSVKQVGGLFAALQVVVVGVKLSSSMRKMKREEESGSVPWTPLVLLYIPPVTTTLDIYVEQMPTVREILIEDGGFLGKFLVKEGYLLGKLYVVEGDPVRKLFFLDSDQMCKLCGTLFVLGVCAVDAFRG